LTQAGSLFAYTTLFRSSWLKAYAADAGFLLALVVWAVVALVIRGRATAAGANGSSYAEITERLVAARTAIATAGPPADESMVIRSEEHTSELQSRLDLV